MLLHTLIEKINAAMGTSKRDKVQDSVKERCCTTHRHQPKAIG
uniref:Uncharacterized protein n=1 Tax=Setaria italica TaxID=4555 RepID=K3Z171_SETIT